MRAKRLSEWRRLRGWTVVELAVRANLSETTVRRLEQGLAGSPRPATAQALAGALGVSPWEIVELSPPAAGPGASPSRRSAGPRRKGT